MKIGNFLTVSIFFIVFNSHFDKLFNNSSYNLKIITNKIIYKRVLTNNNDNNAFTKETGQSSSTKGTSGDSNKQNIDDSPQKGLSEDGKSVSAGSPITSKYSEQSGDNINLANTPNSEDSGNAGTFSGNSNSSGIVEGSDDNDEDYNYDGENDDDDDGDEDEDEDEDEDKNLCLHNNGGCGEDKLCEYLGRKIVKCFCKEGYKLVGTDCVKSSESSSLSSIFCSFLTFIIIIILASIN
ncbi:merozoite surface protein 4, putative [Plasmodium malariae]|uniref:Merozoite surface protein 4, putative n=1 Tax=Plasmodium malariae TaxID=5858 RepID=A0A1C3KAQ6_PLAMA|nr:merozoite surface protein 4, putative [Plasmodium malariae]